MSDKIQVGDRVSWQQGFSSYRRFMRHFTGTVRTIRQHTERSVYAVVATDPDGRWLMVDVDRLTRIPVTASASLSEANVTDSALVAAVAAKPADDTRREQAIHDLRRAVDDYEFAVGEAGNLGGTELI